jgi:hypothetical protein
MEGVMEWYTMKSNVMGRMKWKWNYCDCQVEQKKITNHSQLGYDRMMNIMKNIDILVLVF